MAVARAVAVLAIARPSTVLTGGAQTQKLHKFKPLCYSSTTPSSRKLILYSKPGCCLCDGLKEKLQSAFSLSGPHSLNDVDLQVRDITSNPEWEKAYQYEIPVLAKVLSDGTERVACSYIVEQPWNGNNMPATASLQHCKSVTRGFFGSLEIKPKETLPRLSPRLGVELLQKKIAAALGEQ